MRQVRLILDPPAAGTWNMAVDEALLSSCSETAATTLRVYAWSEPTLSLGYFQAAADRGAHGASANCAVVRRATGGGAILHDREMTYSFTTPVRDRNGRDVHGWYDAFHRSLAATLDEGGVRTTLCGQTNRGLETRFLCFQRRSAGDLLLGPAKIAGSAQRRQRRAMLQHGSLLLKTSPFAPELPGITDLGPVDLLSESFTQRWLAVLADQLQLDWCEAGLSVEERQRATVIEQKKFSQPRWTLRR